ncbi:fluoride efflux transporter FluC [Corynebacterium ulceribovis]|uniref:fluoride efflux transporter FluC n=1 Tax=Corynebacterium ulceribovis TaxID=487732 RepID=UPI0009FEFF6D|nr:CrcB family protein [Corynebacterium ulceribovis]
MTSPAPAFDPRAAAQVSLGAAVGACLRLVLSVAFPGPWLIVAVNAAGCALLGLVTVRARRFTPLLGPGLCGGFTTFSAFALPLAEGTGWLPAAVTVVVCPLAYWLAVRGHDK